MSKDQNDDRPVHPVELEIARLLLEAAIDIQREDKERQKGTLEIKQQQEWDQQKAKLQARARRRWKQIEKLEKQGRLPVCSWMIESGRVEEEEGYGVVIWYATDER